MTTRPPRGVPGRVFADDYSSTGQRAWRDGERGPTLPGLASDSAVGGALWRRNYRGQLRFDSLVSRRLVVPDSHVLDGAFFLETPPETLRDELGQPRADGRASAGDLPLVVRMRATTFEATLRRFLVAEGSETLNGFTFKSIPDVRAQDALAEQLAITPTEVLEERLARDERSALAVGGLLRDALKKQGFEADVDEFIGPLEQGWSYWIEQQELIPSETYETDRDFHPAEALRFEPLDPKAEGLREPAAAAYDEIVELLMAGTRNRSAVTRVLREYRAQTSDPLTLEQLHKLDQWYSRARYRAIAHQHRASYVQLWGDPEPFGPLQRLFESRVRAASEVAADRIELPEDCLTGLADLPNAEWAAFLERHIREVHRWWATGDQSALRVVMAGLVDALVPERKSSRLFGLAIPDAAVASALAGTGATVATAIAAGPLVALIGSAVGGGASIAQATRQPRRQMERRMMDVALQTDGRGRGSLPSRIRRPRGHEPPLP